MAKKVKETNIEEKLQNALVPDWKWPYKLPENWCWTNGFTILKPMESTKPTGDTFQYIDIDAIDNKNQIVTMPKTLKVENAPSRASRKLNNGDTLFSLVRPYLRNIAFIDELNANAIASTGFYVCKPQDNVFPMYLFYLMCSDYVVDNLNKFMKGDNSPSIRGRNIETFAFPLPPLAEQKRIVNRIESLFAKLDEAKELAQNALDSFENRKSAILHKAFTGELTKKWREENCVSFDSWEEKLLSDTDLQIIDGDRGSNYPKKEEFTSSGFCLFLNAKNVTKNGFEFYRNEFITKEKDDLLRKGKLQRNDIVLTTRGTIGNIALYDNSVPFENIRINSGMVIYRGGKQFFKPYLIWLYKSKYILEQIENIKSGSAQPQLPIKDMKNLMLILPNLPEQQEIVRILDSIFAKEAEAKELASVIDKIDLIKKSILSKAFRGELGTNNANEESSVGLLKEIIKAESSKPLTVNKRKSIKLDDTVMVQLTNALEETIYKIILNQPNNFENIINSLPPSKQLNAVEAIDQLVQKNLLTKKDDIYFIK